MDDDKGDCELIFKKDDMLFRYKLNKSLLINKSKYFQSLFRYDVASSYNLVSMFDEPITTFMFNLISSSYPLLNKTEMLELDYVEVIIAVCYFMLDNSIVEELIAYILENMLLFVNARLSNLDELKELCRFSKSQNLVMYPSLKLMKTYFRTNKGLISKRKIYNKYVLLCSAMPDNTTILYTSIHNGDLGVAIECDLIDATELEISIDFYIPSSRLLNNPNLGLSQYDNKIHAKIIVTNGSTSEVLCEKLFNRNSDDVYEKFKFYNKYGGICCMFIIMWFD